MYSVKGDNITIYNDIYVTESAKATNPKLTLKDNSAGEFEITLPPGNAGYESLQRMSSEIIVYRDNNEIWSGRIISEKKDFMNNRILTCEGELAYLNDTLQPPNKYEFSDENQGVRRFLSGLLEIHNSKVANDKKFTIGAVTVHEKNISVCTDNENTLDVINKNLLECFGGHLRVRKEDGVRYLDYLKDWPSTNTQEIRFGQNLLDFTRNWDMTDLATVITPRGAKLDESPIPELEACVDVSSVNGGSRYVANEEGVSEFGWIEKVVDWEDITEPDELLAEAREYLENQQFDEMVLEVSAVDLRYLGITSDSVMLLDEVRCISRPHGLDRVFPVSELTIQLDKPENSTYTLGSTVQNTFTASVKSENASIIHKIDSKPTTQQILTSAKNNATQLINTATRGYVTIVKSSSGTQSIVISSDLSYNPDTDLWSSQTRMWRWNINGLGYSKDGGRTYGTAITMDGAIVADYITTGTISTVLIKDVNGNSSWDLSTGIFTMKKGSISLGVSSNYPNGRFSVNDYGYLTAEYGKIGGFTIDAYSIYNDVVSLDSVGLGFYEGGDYLGNYGTQYWEKQPSSKGLTVSLENNTSYVAWGYKETASADSYTIKLMYTSNRLPKDDGGYFNAGRLHFGCDIDANGWLAYNCWIDSNTGGCDGGVTYDDGKPLRLGVVSTSGSVTGYISVRIVNGFMLPG